MKELQSSQAATQFIQGLSFPISKADILRKAAEAKLTDTITQQLTKIRDRDYRDADDLTAELNAAS